MDNADAVEEARRLLLDILPLFTFSPGWERAAKDVCSMAYYTLICAEANRLEEFLKQLDTRMSQYADVLETVLKLFENRLIRQSVSSPVNLVLVRASKYYVILKESLMNSLTQLTNLFSTFVRASMKDFQLFAVEYRPQKLAANPSSICRNFYISETDWTKLETYIMNSRNATKPLRMTKIICLLGVVKTRFTRGLRHMTCETMLPVYIGLCWVIYQSAGKLSMRQSSALLHMKALWSRTLKLILSCYSPHIQLDGRRLGLE
jgi:hypothetical protein